MPSPPFLDTLSRAWQADNLHLLEHCWRPEAIQLTFSSMPDVSPVFFAARVKGRLQHALRQQGHPARFSRKLTVRSIGHNTTAEVEAYVRQQTDRSDHADERWHDKLKAHVVTNEQVDLTRPVETRSGRYWYNLHMVLAAAGRYRIGDEQTLATIGRTCQSIAEKKGYGLAETAIMPDHLHIALRGNIEHSPQEIVLSFQNNLAYCLGQKRIWQETYYVGTFGEYTMGAVRRGTYSPAT